MSKTQSLEKEQLSELYSGVNATPEFMLYINQIVPTLRPPQRIVSLVPSQTEVLFHLGLHAETVGITKFCVHPDQWFQTKKRVGGTKTLHLEEIRALRPDLILANKEENLQEQVEALQHICPVWVSDIQTLEDAVHMISSIGIMTHKKQEATEIVRQIENGYRQLPALTHGPSALYLIWRQPWMSIGKDTFIHDVMQRLGMRNVTAHSLRYPELTAGQIAQYKPDIILLSSEPYPFGKKHIDEIQCIAPHARVILVDGEMFSWYGSRMLYAPGYFRPLLEQIAGTEI